MKNKNYRKFNLVLLPLIVFNLLLVGIFNAVVDPYGILNSLGIVPENKPKLENNKLSPSPSPSPSLVVAKAISQQERKKNQPPTTLLERSKYRAERFKINLSKLSVTRINPKTIVLGTSTALRLSPDHPALTGQPVYNLGLPGAKMHDIKTYFEDILANHPDLQQVVIGIDFFSFGGPEVKIKPVPEVKPIPDVKQVTEVRKNKYSYSLTELLQINFSLDTLNASLKNIVKNYSTPSNQREKSEPRSASPQFTKISVEPAQASYRQLSLNLSDGKSNSTKTLKKPPNKKPKNANNTKEVKEVRKAPKQAVQTAKKDLISYRDNNRLIQFRRVILLYWNEKTLYKDYNLSKEELNDFKSIIDTCRKRQIAVRVFFSPVHAAQLEAIHTAGLWQAFEEWKRQVVQITPAWDFSNYTSFTTEPINDRMEHFADSVHYQDRVADLILNRIYNYHQEKVPANFGIFVTPANIESQITKIRAERQAWLKTKPDAVKFVEDIKKQSSASRQ